ncbi:unnamed protein product [Lactuca saligna]|uniref:Uncharacterized protein n=1 Tax=Lactuca saligna TaxID=75948 RepID=A0AA35YIV8_LACSI|nr:unnamed protein product [Lactuca saligna]
MDQDFESPIVKQKVFPSEGAQASGSSFEAPVLNFSKGKSKLPEYEFVDVALLQNKFGDDFQPLSAEGEKISASSSGPVNPIYQHKNQVMVEQLRGKMLVMKHSNQNSLGDHPEMFFRETGKKFTDKYGDRSGILMWGYDADKKMWIVKCYSEQIEYYEK